MNRKLLGIVVLMATLLGCTSTQSISNYYGADLSKYPPNVSGWIMKSAFPKNKMEQKSMKNSKLKVWWNNDNNEVLAEASFIIAEGYVGAGTLERWGQGVCYSGDPDIFNVYGQYAKYQTLRFKWELKQEAERLLKKDPAYAEVIKFAKKLCAEIEYDWANYNAYKGPVKPTPKMRRAVCEGYANEVMDKILKLRHVKSVQKWSSPGHAWNVVKLVDGRTLYFDLTWFDNDHIDEKTGKIYQRDDYNWENITFNAELFRYSGVGYGTKQFEHDSGKLVEERTK